MADNSDVESSRHDTNATEDTPLLAAPEEQDWKPPRGFIWIEIGTLPRQISPSHVLIWFITAIFANVFLGGFDGTITASTYAIISSGFSAANTASWLATSYLITSTAFQPLYGRFSDVFGWRACFFIATILFMLGCLGCALARNVWLLNFMRALTGIGGGGLMTVGEYGHNQEKGDYR